MKYLYAVLALVLMTACAEDAGDPPFVEECHDAGAEAEASVELIEQASWEGCYNHVGIPAKVDPHYAWDWNTHHSYWVATDPAPLWRSHGTKFNLFFQDTSGWCAYNTTDDTIVYADVPSNYICVRSGNGWYCHNNGVHYLCPSSVTFPRPTTVTNNWTNGPIISWEPPRVTQATYDMGSASFKSTRMINITSTNVQRIECVYDTYGKAFWHDRW